MSKLNISDAFQTVCLLYYEVKNVRDRFTTNVLAYFSSLVRPMYVILDHSEAYVLAHNIRARIRIIRSVAELVSQYSLNSTVTCLLTSRR